MTGTKKRRKKENVRNMWVNQNVEAHVFRFIKKDFNLKFYDIFL